MAAQPPRGVKALALLPGIARSTAEHPSPAGIYGALQTIRLAEAYLHLFPKEVPPTRLLHQLGDFRRAADELRDVYAQSVILGFLRRVYRVHGLGELKLYLVRRREKREANLVRVIKEHVRNGFDKRCTHAARYLTTGFKSVEMHDLASEFIDGQSTGYTSARLDEFRLACMRARYAAELAAESPLQRVFVRQLTNINEACEEWHDTIKLAEIAEERLGITHPVSSMLRARYTFEFNEALWVIPECTSQVATAMNARPLPLKSPMPWRASAA